MMNTIRIENIGKDVTKVKKFAQEVDQFNETATRCNKHILEDNVKVILPFIKSVPLNARTNSIPTILIYSTTF